MLDAHSHKAVSWHMSTRIDSKLVLDCLRRAVEERTPPGQWIHHSDQGIQYACNGYTQAVRDSGGRPSMSSKACPYDNAKAESFFVTLKKEEVHREEYHTLEQAQASIGSYIDNYYNSESVHSRLGYCLPEELELELPCKTELAKA